MGQESHSNHCYPKKCLDETKQATDALRQYFDASNADCFLCFLALTSAPSSSTYLSSPEYLLLYPWGSMDQSTEHPHAENPDTGIAVSAARPRSLTMTESEADIEMQLAPENLDDFSEFEKAIASPSDTSLGRVFTPSTTHNTASSAFLVVAAHPDQSPNNKTANPTSQSDETAETLATPALSHAHFSPPPQDNEHRSLPQNYPPIIYPDIGLPLAQGSQSNSGGKIAAHTQREAMDVDMAGVGRNHCEDTLAEPTTLPSNYPPVIYPALRSPRPDDSRLYLGGETGVRVLTRPGRQTEDEVIVIEDEDENESGSEGEYTSSEVSDGQDLKVYRYILICHPTHIDLTFDNLGRPRTCAERRL